MRARKRGRASLSSVPADKNSCLGAWAGAHCLFRGRGGERRERERGGGIEGHKREEKTSKVRGPSSHMGCVVSTDWCGEDEVRAVPVVRSSSLKRRSLERSDSSKMRLTKVSVCALFRCVCDEITDVLVQDFTSVTNQGYRDKH